MSEYVPAFAFAARQKQKGGFSIKRCGPGFKRTRNGGVEGENTRECRANHQGAHHGAPDKYLCSG
jgi:hypothetical protein